MGLCRDELLLHLNRLGYNVLRAPQVSVVPLSLIGLDREGAVLLGKATRIFPATVTVPLVVHNDEAASVLEGCKSGELAASLGLKVLERVVEALGGSSAFRTAYARSTSIQVELADVRADTVAPRDVALYLRSVELDADDPIVAKYVLGSGSLFLVTDTIKSDKLVITSRVHGAPRDGIDIALLQGHLGGKTAISTDESRPGRVLFEAASPLTFGFRCYQVGVDGKGLTLGMAPPVTNTASATTIMAPQLLAEAELFDLEVGHMKETVPATAIRHPRVGAIGDMFLPVLNTLLEGTSVDVGADVGRAALDVLNLRRRDDLSARRGIVGSPRKRYLISGRMNEMSANSNAATNLRAVHQLFATSRGGTGDEPTLLRTVREDAPKVVRMSPLEAELIRERFPSLVVEDDLQYELLRSPVIGGIELISVPASAGRAISMRVRTGQEPAPGAEVILFPNTANRRGYRAVTNAQGEATVIVRNESTFARVMIEPRSESWSRMFTDVRVSAPLEFTLDRFTTGGFEWGHKVTQAAKRDERGQTSWDGDGVKVAIIDTGIGRHKSLQGRIAGGHNFIVGEDADQWNDHDGHGTHAAGIVAALSKPKSTWGYAPRVQLYALRVFGGADGGGYSSDIAEAIRWATDNGCHIISMSFRGEQHGAVRQQIERATGRGVLCVAAAGNDGGEVSYPAKYPDVVGVSAIGQFGTYPNDSIHREAETEICDRERNYYLASFSNRGDGIDFCAPGVAIKSTFLDDKFASWDGTSMACPHVAGIASIVLSACPQILESPRDSWASLLLDRLNDICVDLGLGRHNQGSGLPVVGRLPRRFDTPRTRK
jgi:subtilisin